MNITNGTKQIKRNTLTAIAEISFSNGYILYVFPGTLSPNDILLKYKGPNTNSIRTPRHIHWAVDILLKKSNSQQLTNSFLNAVTQYWNSCGILPGRTYNDILNIINNATSQVQLQAYTQLDSFGEYPTEFLFVLMCLLAVQEKTNANHNGTIAHMFGDILNELSKTSLDIFKIMSTAGFGGR